jgi:hypothetical protein
MAEEPDDGRRPDEDGEGPLGDLAERIRSRRSAEGDRADAESFEGLEEFFEEEPYEEVDADELWDALEGEPDPTAGVETGESPDEHIVPKRQYCESCEYFSEPPEVHCTHPGTTIVEFEDSDHVRVRNCPIVAERQALGEVDDAPMTPGSFGHQ